MKNINSFFLGLLLMIGFSGQAQAVYYWGQSPQLNSQGHVVWHGYHEDKREIFIHDDNGEALRLTDNDGLGDACENWRK